VPVLAEQAIKRASLIEDSQVLIAVFSSSRIGEPRITSPGSTRTDPVSYAVGGQGIVIPADIAFHSRGTDKFISFVEAQSAIAPFPKCHTTLINAKMTAMPLSCFGGLIGQVKWLPGGIVGFFNKR
jgi:hypothetical protein